jgi:hypothetical protein
MAWGGIDGREQYHGKEDHVLLMMYGVLRLEAPYLA